MNLAGPGSTSHDRPIIWDGMGLSSPHSGVGYYGSSLYHACFNAGKHVFVTCFPGDAPTFVGAQQSVTIEPLKRSPGGANSFLDHVARLKPIFSSLSYSTIKNRFPAVTYHGLSNVNLPCFVRHRPQDRFVITIHDIIPLLRRDPSLLAIQTRILLPRVMRLASAIIVPSRWTRESLLEFFGDTYEPKIHIIPNGTATIIQAKTNTPSTTADFDCDVLSVARGESYKRLELVLAIAKALPTLRFHIVTDLAGHLRLAGAPDNVKIFREISQEVLATMYQRAKVFLHTSLFEGWCLPAADAVMAKLFVIYVKGTGIDDVCSFAGGRCHALDPQTAFDNWVDAVKSAIVRFPGPPASAHKATELPTWQDCAEKTLKIYDSLL